jgi:wyosine [tRNA(Phe)-imidazoG37] synthetase (radical SAM superfamily)
VYPVLSRRSGGISIGVNLSPDKTCNFRCVYCQVDRETKEARGLPTGTFDVDLGVLAEELDAMADAVQSGRLFEGPRFGQTPDHLRRLNDIALSGDGEPTLFPRFAEAVEACAEVRRKHRLDDVKLVLITNATLLDRESVRQGLAILDAANGEIWAKLDAGTEDYYRRVSRSHVPFAKILDNLCDAARVRPIVIQTLLMRLDGQPPSAEELAAYCQRLADIRAAGGQIKLVQLHTVARRPAESYVTALPDAEMDAIADQVRWETGLVVAVFYR